MANDINPPPADTCCKARPAHGPRVDHRVKGNGEMDYFAADRAAEDERLLAQSRLVDPATKRLL